MPLEKIKKYIFLRPGLMDLLKKIFSNKLLANNKLYQMYTQEAAQRYARKHPHGVMGVFIETTLNCNSKCKMCYHGYKQLQGIMSMDLFKKIIDDCHANHITDIGLSMYGEPLLDPHLFERICYLRQYNMSYGFFTNAALLDIKKARMFFELSALKKINFSVCGYDPQVYEAIMVGLNRDTTYKNIIGFLRLKEEYKRDDLEVVISTVKLNLNKADMKDFVRFWRKQKGVNQIITADLWDRIGDQDINEIGKLGSLSKKGNWCAPCKQLWGSFNIYFDGRVSPCCDDGDLRQLIIGDMNTQTLQKIYNSGLIENLRKQHLENKRSLHKVCGACSHSSVWISV
jgi:MoaA/NifB/PqqE/SkfB family radical SAM enzyme